MCELKNFSDFETKLRKKFCADTLTVYQNNELIFGNPVSNARYNIYKDYDTPKFITTEDDTVLDDTVWVKSQFVLNIDSCRLLLIVSSGSCDAWRNTTKELLQALLDFTKIFD